MEDVWRDVQCSAGVLVRVLTKEHEVDPILVQQGLHLPLEALHLLVVLVVAVVAACKVLLSSDHSRARATRHCKTAVRDGKKMPNVPAWACKLSNTMHVERHELSRCVGGKA